jgi:predicted component of type VI protein secretion system
MNLWWNKNSLLIIAACLVGLAAFLISGCAAGYLDPGPSPSKIRVKLKAEARQQPKSWRFGGPYPVTWDWGLYLVRSDDTLATLGPEDKQRLTVLQENPLVRDTVFLAPSGKLKLRLILDAYYFEPEFAGYRPVSLGGTIRDFHINLPQGSEKILEITYPEP